MRGIMERAVARALKRRVVEAIRHLGVDEKASRKGQSCVTLVDDLERSRVLYVAEGRKQSSLDGFWPTLSAEQRAPIDAMAMDMWDLDVASTQPHFPDAESKIVFDKYHMTKYLGEAVDQVRRQEHKTLKRRAATGSAVRATNGCAAAWRWNPRTGVSSMCYVRAD